MAASASALNIEPLLRGLPPLRTDLMKKRTLFDKIWDSHVVVSEPDCPSVFYIDLHLIHEVTSPQAFQGLRERGLKVRRPDRTVATMDHIVPTRNQNAPIAD